MKKKGAGDAFGAEEKREIMKKSQGLLWKRKAFS
jgi:hypothetical protein